MGSKILLIHQENEAGEKLKSALQSEGHKVVGIISDLKQAYKALLDKSLELAVIDLSIDDRSVEILSDTLNVLGVNHIMLTRDPVEIVKRDSATNRFVRLPIKKGSTVAKAVCEEVWEMHMRGISLFSLLPTRWTAPSCVPVQAT